MVRRLKAVITNKTSQSFAHFLDLGQFSDSKFIT